MCNSRNNYSNMWFWLGCYDYRQKGGRPNARLFSYVDSDSYVNLDEVGLTHYSTLSFFLICPLSVICKDS